MTREWYFMIESTLSYRMILIHCHATKMSAFVIELGASL
jgi:hypothetical protein